jgi:hypothetical protein
MRHWRWNRTTPIILISDNQRPSAMTVGFEAGASFFLYKPIDRERLLKLVRATQGAMEYGRRRTRRVPLQSKVRLKFGAEILEAETVDLSLSGILVKAGRTLPLGSPVHFSLDVSSRMKPVVGLGSIVRVFAALSCCSTCGIDRSPWSRSWRSDATTPPVHENVVVRSLLVFVYEIVGVERHQIFRDMHRVRSP